MIGIKVEKEHHGWVDAFEESGEETVMIESERRGIS
jgi:hypothetical protein